MADKKSSPLPASSAGLLRFFEDETKGVKVDPRIAISMPISIIAISWALEFLLVP
jgi:preprotein translocase subunit Sec61beta